MTLRTYILLAVGALVGVLAGYIVGGLFPWTFLVMGLGMQ